MMIFKNAELKISIGMAMKYIDNSRKDGTIHRQIIYSYIILFVAV